MKKIFALMWAIICIVGIGFAEPEETAGEVSTQPLPNSQNTTNPIAPNVSNLPQNTQPTSPTQNNQNTNIPAGLLGSAPLTPANQINGAPIEDMLENVNESNNTLKSAMVFADRKSTRLNSSHWS